MLLEALSATGLRSIRYAKEIPLVKSALSSACAAESLTNFLRYVIANDLSDAATEAIRKNVEINGFSEKPTDPNVPGSTPTPAKVVVNEGDAWYLLFC